MERHWLISDPVVPVLYRSTGRGFYCSHVVVSAVSKVMAAFVRDHRRRARHSFPEQLCDASDDPERSFVAGHDCFVAAGCKAFGPEFQCWSDGFREQLGNFFALYDVPDAGDDRLDPDDVRALREWCDSPYEDDSDEYALFRDIVDTAVETFDFEEQRGMEPHTPPPKRVTFSTSRA